MRLRGAGAASRLSLTEELQFDVIKSGYFYVESLSICLYMSLHLKSISD